MFCLLVAVHDFFTALKHVGVELVQGLLTGQIQLALLAKGGAHLVVAGHRGGFQSDGGGQQGGSAGHAGSLGKGGLHGVAGVGRQHALAGQEHGGFLAGHEGDKAEGFGRMLGVLAHGDEGAQSAGGYGIILHVEGGQVGHVPVGNLDALVGIVLEHGDGPFTVDEHGAVAQAEVLEPVNALSALLRKAHVGFVLVQRAVADLHPLGDGGEIVVQQVRIALIGGQRSIQPVGQEAAPELRAVFLIGHLLGDLQILIPGDALGIRNAHLVKEGLVVVQGIQRGAVGQAVILIFERGFVDDGAIAGQIQLGFGNVGGQGHQGVQRHQVQDGCLRVAADQIHVRAVGGGHDHGALVVVVMIDEAGFDVDVRVGLLKHFDQLGHVAFLIGPAVVIQRYLIGSLGQAGRDGRRHEDKSDYQRKYLFHIHAPFDLGEFVLPVVKTPDIAEQRKKRIDSLLKIFEDEKIDMMIDNYFHSSMLPWNAIAARIGGVRYVVYDHGNLVSWMNYVEDCFTERFDWLKLSDAVVSLSSVQKHLYDAMGIPSVIIPNPTEKYCSNLQHKGRILNESSCKILWVGRFEYQKKPLDAVRSFERIKSRYPGAQLYMLGQGSEEQKVKDYINQNSIGNVYMEGFQRDIDTYYKSCDVLLITSEYESWSLVLREAMAHGMPVIAYMLNNIDIMSEANGIVAVEQDDIESLADAVIGVCSDRERYRVLSEKAYQWFQEYKDFDWNTAWSTFITVIGDGKANDYLSKVENDECNLIQAMIRYHGNGMKRAITTIEELEEDAIKGRSRTYKFGEAVAKPFKWISQALHSFI